MKIPQKVHVKKKICPWKFWYNSTRETKIDAREKFNKIDPWQGISSLKSAPAKQKFQPGKKWKKCP